MNNINTLGFFAISEMSDGLTPAQRRQYIANRKQQTHEYLESRKPMISELKYEKQYQADLKAMGGNLSVSKEDYIASLKATDAGGFIGMAGVEYQPAASTATLEAKPDPMDDKYRQQFRADKAVLGAQLTATEEEYIFSLKATDAGGVLNLH
ncbi:hypothetical protein [Gimesia algae]|uniref:Uncharacterized protein n=1 Tax=Gimesia algae TaxID=2527971 RepID=A0A517V822_9PLAN|nr:hypothetical protein [Gimesia algae]QDT89161.1 hypothetical protein Pan161_07870 [Gimesia algae]